MITVNTIAAGASGVSTKPPPATRPSMTPAIRIWAGAEPCAKTTHGSMAHSADSTPAWNALLRTTAGLTRVGTLRRCLSHAARPIAHIVETRPHQLQRSHGGTSAGRVSASRIALSMLSPISQGDTKVTHWTRRARISADSVSRPR